MNTECRRCPFPRTFLIVLLAGLVALAGCTNPEKAKAEYVSKGEAYLKDSKFQEASLEFRNAIQIDDQYAAAHWGLARAYEKLFRYPEMIQELQKTIQLDKNNLDARTKLGTYYIAAGQGRAENIEAADKLADEVLQKDPKNIEGHILKGTVYFAKKDINNALDQLKQAIDLDPKRIESHLSLSRFYLATNEPAKAEEVIKQAITVNPNSPLGYTEYAKLLVQLGRQPEAEAELIKAVEVAPKDHDARFLLASYYLVNRQNDKAEQAYKDLVALDPDKPESQATLADFYANVNRYDEAIQIYKNVLAKSPDYMQGRYRLAEILMMHGDSQAASAQIEEALKKDKTDRQALLLRARLNSLGGQPNGLKAAIEDLKEVLKQEPNSRPGLYFMAQTNYTLGNLDQARAFAGDLEKNYPQYLPAKLIKVQIALASGDPKTASTMATDLLDRLNKTPVDRENSPQLLAEVREKTFLARGTAQLQLRNNAGARQDFESARGVSPSDPAVYNSLAIVSALENKPDDAVGFWESALKIDGANFVALSGVLRSYTQKGEVDKAHARIDQAIATYQNVASLHLLKAQLYGAQQNAQGAEAELRKAIELDPNYIAAYNALGALFINTKQEERAIAEFKKVLEIRPGDASAYTLIGMLEDSRKNYDAAAENYKKALETDPNASIAANNLAWLYAVTGKGNLDEAIRLAQGVVQRNPSIPGFIDTLGWVYYKKGLASAAVEQLQKAVTMDEQAARTNNVAPSASYHYHLGMALKAKGDNESAKRELEASVKLADKAPFSDLDDAKKNLASL